MHRDSGHLLEGHGAQDRISRVRDDFAFDPRGPQTELVNIRAAHLERLGEVRRKVTAWPAPDSRIDLA